MGLQQAENLFQVLEVRFVVGAVHKDIIEINDTKFIKKLFQYLMHQSHESAKSIAKPKRHHSPLKEAIRSFECGLPFTPCLIRIWW